MSHHQGATTLSGEQLRVHAKLGHAICFVDVGMVTALELVALTYASQHATCACPFNVATQAARHGSAYEQQERGLCSSSLVLRPQLHRSHAWSSVQHAQAGHVLGHVSACMYN